MSEPRTKLRMALEAAKTKLEGRHLVADKPMSNEASPSPAPASKLNTLLGTAHVPPQRVSLFQRVGVTQRPTYDLLAERVLGADVAAYQPKHSGYAEHVAARLRTLRGRWTMEAEESEEELTSMVGWEVDGRPVWRKVLDDRRGEASSISTGINDDIVVSDEPLKATTLKRSAAWPSPLSRSNHRTFKQWYVGEENFSATQACERAWSTVQQVP